MDNNRNSTRRDVSEKKDDRLSDEALVGLAAEGNANALDEIIGRYKNLVRARARTYFLVGADSEDIVQEGMIGLFKAIRDYDASKQAMFSSFAELCITRQIMTAIKTATRNKHIPLNTYISLNKPLYDDDSERALIDVMAEESACDPEELLLLKEQITTMERVVKSELSPFETDVLTLYLDGCSYQDIAVALKAHIKSVDNALQRIKRKLGRVRKIKMN
ncbi:MAG: RNA polymerase sigma-H factor [Firmicutes bacterium ADurb.Bin193]|nr:MAG: RNA polymerase sigma-H factor [Firmicutes bacterium ADurb.Bin193]